VVTQFDTHSIQIAPTENDKDVVARFKDMGNYSKIGNLHFVKFYLSATRLGMTYQDMYNHLGYTKKTYAKQEQTYIENRVSAVRDMLKKMGFTLPASNDDMKHYKWYRKSCVDASDVEFLENLNWKS
jgi:hypothetical protein